MLATLMVTGATLSLLAVLLFGALDAVSTWQRGQHIADMAAISAMEASPLVGGVGQVNGAALGRLVASQHASLMHTDTTGWPLRVRVTIRAQPNGIMKPLWAGPELSAMAEVVPP